MNLLGAIGKRPCEKVLEKILEENNDKKLVRWATNIIFKFKEGLKQIEYLPDKQYQETFRTYWRHHFMKRVLHHPAENITEDDKPEVLRTHLWCCLHAYYKESL